jgi:adenylate cyclase
MLDAVKTTNSKAHDFPAWARGAVGTIRNRDVPERSTDLFAQAIAEDPSYEPYAGIAMAQVLNWQFHWTDD